MRQAQGQTLQKAARIVAQSGQRKAVDGYRTLHSFHAPEVDCISKAKRMIARKGVAFLQCLYLRLCAMAGVPPNWQDALGALLMRTRTCPAPYAGWVRI